MKILLIEPDRLLQKQYAEALISAGYKLRVVGDAQAGILAADKISPDLVVLEPLLASHGGMEFLYEFRSYSEWQNIPVVINSRVSSDDLGLSQKLQSELRVAAVLYKPESSLKKLLEVIKGLEK